MFEPSEIAFSVAMYLIMCMIGSKNLPDKELADSLFKSYLGFSIFFISLFAVAVFLNTYNDNYVNKTIDALNETINALRECRNDMNTNTISSNEMKPVLDRIRIAILLLSGIAIILSELARDMHKIKV